MTHRKYKANRLWLAPAAVIALFVSASGSHALDQRQLAALKVMAGESDSSLESFGSLSSFMGRLRRAGRVCRLSSYAYGANLDCGPAKAPDMLVGLNFAPTRAPEFLLVGSVRANGINGGELPRAKVVEYLRDYLKASPAPRKPTP